MTEALHLTRTHPAPDMAPQTPEAASRSGLPSTGSTGTLPIVEPPVVAQTRGHSLLDDGPTPPDLTALSTRQLRVLANKAYKLMDTDYPPAGAMDSYEMIVDELELRTRQAASRRDVLPSRESFRDNPLYRRFELYIDGTLAASLRYTLNGGRLVLLDGVEHPGFNDQGIDMILMRHIVLNAHQRRLDLVPECPMALSFLAENPQYKLLIARPTHEL